MNALVLGGNGYLGSRIVRRLLAADFNVVCTRRSTSDISGLSDVNDTIKWISATIDSIDLELAGIEYDFVINMVCNYGNCDKLYDNILASNFEFPLEVLNASAHRGVKNFVTIDTGLPDDFNMYSFSKNKFSEFGRFYSEKHKINFANILLEMFYGSDEPENRFLPSVIRKMISGETVETTIGTQHRDIISEDDVIDAIFMVMMNMPVGYCDIPVGTGVAPSISEIIDYIWIQTGKKSNVLKGAVQMRPNEPDCVADTTQINRLGLWKPTDWQTGISRMVSDIEKQMVERK